MLLLDQPGQRGAWTIFTVSQHHARLGGRKDIEPLE